MGKLFWLSWELGENGLEKSMGSWLLRKNRGDLGATREQVFMAALLIGCSLLLVCLVSS